MTDERRIRILWDGTQALTRSLSITDIRSINYNGGSKTSDISKN